MDSPNTTTIYPVSPTGDRFRTVPEPLTANLQDLLDVIGRQDLNQHAGDDGGSGPGHGIAHS